VAVFFAEILHTDISINQEKHTFYNYYTNWMLLWHHSLIVCVLVDGNWCYWIRENKGEYSHFISVFLF